MMNNIKEYLAYDPLTGDFTWIKSTYRRGKPGQKAGCLSAYGYWRIPFMGKYYFAHRLAWFYVYGEFPDFQIDHKNRIRTDNRIDNLRPAANGQNNFNAAGKGSRTGVKGVVKNGNRFYGRVHFRYKSYNAGSFKTLEEARDAVSALRAKLHKEFACDC